MDNVTHTLIGALIGTAAARAARPDPSGLPADTRRNLLVTLSAIGSNLPDADLLYSFFGEKVNYLLHHRGHTHTIVGAVLLAALTFAVVRWLMQRRGLTASRRDRCWLAGMLGASALLHVGMDATNNYGVHPFWPLYNGWFYGDSVFIVEPLFWAACAPLVFTLRTRTARLLVAALLALAVALILFSGFFTPAVAATSAAMTVGMAVLAHRTPLHVAVAAGIAAWLLVTAVFLATSRVAARRADALAGTLFPHARLVDRVLTPMPANPLCWEIMFVQVDADALTLRRAMLALVPTAVTADKCLSRSLDVPTTAPLMRVPVPDTAAVKWYGEIATLVDRYAQLAATNCQVAAAMRFIRAPWIAAVESRSVLGDLRYDRERALGFAEIELADPPAACPSIVPPWQPPRAELLPE